MTKSPHNKCKHNKLVQFRHWRHCQDTTFSFTALATSTLMGHLDYRSGEASVLAKPLRPAANNNCECGQPPALQRTDELKSVQISTVNLHPLTVPDTLTGNQPNSVSIRSKSQQFGDSRNATQLMQQKHRKNDRAMF